ncbi:jg2312 [Pararge aegeria aegeria]|uniref:Jg2312 protein n=1 Tax=Pararge aegeria aegeria TaxID=348720 RepID=A0A8S4S950_9NEOP|nr:jg2312 [Pararge aegeria aegeria]
MGAEPRERWQTQPRLSQLMSGQTTLFPSPTIPHKAPVAERVEEKHPPAPAFNRRRRRSTTYVVHPVPHQSPTWMGYKLSDASGN